MSMIHEERSSDSPFVEKIARGWTAGAGSVIRPADSHWHMVFSRYNGCVHPLVVGALPSCGIVSYGEGAEILWVQFKLGTWLPHLSVRDFVNAETPLPSASSRAFWLKGSAWQFPDFENVETFVARLVHSEILVRDPIVDAALRDQLRGVAPRTVRHRFLRTIGLPQTRIRQINRALYALTLLRQGVSILDTIDAAGYFDQPHLTRALQRFAGHTPAQILGTRRRE